MVLKIRLPQNMYFRSETHLQLEIFKLWQNVMHFNRQKRMFGNDSALKWWRKAQKNAIFSAYLGLLTKL